MKLAELCTAFPQSSGTNELRHPGSAIPLTLQLKLRAQRGHLQAALDTHPQRSANRLGLGLRTYESGDSIRAVSTRHLLLQEQLLTRTDVSPGRFHVCVILHSYANMNFRSESTLPSKNQLAWALAGLIQNLHEQQAQKVDILAIGETHLAEQMIRQATRIKRAHFCYVVSDLLFAPTELSAAAAEVTAALTLLHRRHGLVLVVRDPLESPDALAAREAGILTLGAPDELGTTGGDDKHSGPQYVQNLKTQLSDLQTRLNAIGWGSLLATCTDDVEVFTRRIAQQLAGQRISQ